MTTETDTGAGGFSEREVRELAQQAYEGDASFPLACERTALLVIDMQDEFVRPQWTHFWVPDATRQVPRLRRLIETCRRLEVPVIYTAFAATHHGADRPRSGASMPNRYVEIPLTRRGFATGSPGTSLHRPRTRSSSTSRRMARSTTHRSKRS